MGVTFAFTVALIPILINCMHGLRIHLYAAAVTFSGLYILTGMYVSMSMYLAALANFTNGTIWLAIFFYSYSNEKVAHKVPYYQEHDH